MTNTTIDNPGQSISWPRIAGTAFAIALHVVVFMTLMAPVSSQKNAEKDDDVTLVNFIEPPKPPPPPPPPPKEPPKTITRIVETPKPTALPPKSDGAATGAGGVGGGAGVETGLGSL